MHGREWHNMKKLFFLVPALFVFCAAGYMQTPVPAATPYVRPDAKVRFERYVKDTVGPASWIGKVAGAGFATASNSPEEWGGSWKGFGKRVASNFGKGAISQTARYGLDEALKVDSHYYRSADRSTKARLKNAFISTFTARKANGKRTVGVPRIVGTYASNVIASETWYPERYNWKDGMRQGTISLGINVIADLFREFVRR